MGRTCTGLGLGPVDVVRVSCEGPGGPEAAARTARYEALDGAAHRHGAAAVLLGHTRDDQAETVLLGLARGSGTRSLAGMPPARGILRRPLLGLGRDVTAAVCADLGLPVWTDPANSDPAFRRTRVRRLLPELDGALGPGLTAALARTAEIAREDADALDALAEGLFARASVDGVPGTGRVVLDAGVLAAESDAVRRRTVLLAARRAGSPAGALGRRHVLATDALITRWRGQRGTDLPGGVRAERACGRLVFTLAGDPDTDPPVARTNPDRE
ncbi:MAG: tRNA(Ile)-lysidine synthase [Actinomycetota bacterium]|nr:tRNA(Ile)-lysidine synthase [Actinomycetota bacterium]